MDSLQHFITLTRASFPMTTTWPVPEKRFSQNGPREIPRIRVVLRSDIR